MFRGALELQGLPQLFREGKRRSKLLAAPAGMQEGYIEGIMVKETVSDSSTYSNKAFQTTGTRAGSLATQI